MTNREYSSVIVSAVSRTHKWLQQDYLLSQLETQALRAFSRQQIILEFLSAIFHIYWLPENILKYGKDFQSFKWMNRLLTSALDFLKNDHKVITTFPIQGVESISSTLVSRMAPWLLFIVLAFIFFPCCLSWCIFS